MNATASGAAAVLDRLLEAVNAHQLDALVACFAEDYLNVTPVHPPRGFRGREQVRTNWSQIFAAVPDARARVLRRAVDGAEVWTEWEMDGRRLDGSLFRMSGVVIFEVRGDAVASARFFLEPVEDTSGDVDAHTRRVTHAAAGAGAS
ncbi:MAG: nuclear transport factor 2 family protein [Actinomycetota bacterium]|nr:nuclear transport factor 2 family protein [Actinomycetota bacterium]